MARQLELLGESALWTVVGVGTITTDEQTPITKHLNTMIIV